MFFDGNLPAVKILLSDAKNFLGNLRYKIQRRGLGREIRSEFVIRISRAFDRDQEEIEDTLIHEMIHLYIASNHIADKSSHGPQFRQIMNHINNTYGRHITISHRSARDGEIKTTDGRHHWHVIGVVKLKDGRYGFKVIPRVRTTIDKFRKGMLSATLVERVDFYVSDDPYFHKFPNSGSLRLHIMEYTTILDHLNTAIPLFK